MISVYRNTWGLAMLLLAAFLLFAGSAQARNPDLSNWVVNISGDEPPEETLLEDRCPEIEVVGATVHVLYWTGSDVYWGGPQKLLYYRRSTEGGKTWQPKILLYKTVWHETAGLGWKYLAVDGARVHVAYADYQWGVANSCRLIYRRSTDNGASFGDARALAGGYAWIKPTRIAASQGKVTIAFSYQATEGALTTNLATLNSANGGDTFATAEVFSSGDPLYSVSVQDLKRVGNRVYLLYIFDKSDNTILYCATSLDGGATFTHNLMTTPTGNGQYLTYELQNGSYSPNLALDGDNVHVVWTQNDADPPDNVISLYTRRSTDQGRTFSAPQKLATYEKIDVGDITVVPGQETVAAQGGHVYVLSTFCTTQWLRSRYGIRLSRSTDGGTSFLPLQYLGGSGFVRNPVLVVDPANGARFHGFCDYSYWFSFDGGAAITGPVGLMHVSVPGVESAMCQLALGPGDTKHLVARGGCGGDMDIFYRGHGPVPAPSGRERVLQFLCGEGRYDCMNVASTSWLNFTSQMTLEVWVKPGTGYANTFSKGYRYSLDAPYRNGRRRAEARIRTSDGDFSLTTAEGDVSSVVPDNLWTHLAMTYDAGAAGNNFKLYKNGQLIAAMEATGNFETDFGSFIAGPHETTAAGRSEMDELRLWNRCLSQSNIQANMYRKLTGTETGLNAYYQFNDTTRDITGHGNDGILLYKESYVPFSAGAGSVAPVNALLLQD